MNKRIDRTRPAENEDRSPRADTEDDHPSAGDASPDTGGPDQGFARAKDLRDTRSQAKAPQHADHDLDRTGEKQYEAGLHEFEGEESADELDDEEDDESDDDDDEDVDTDADDGPPTPRRGR